MYMHVEGIAGSAIDKDCACDELVHGQRDMRGGVCGHPLDLQAHGLAGHGHGTYLLDIERQP